MRDMIKSDEFKEYSAKLAEHLSDYCLVKLGKDELAAHKAAHDIMEKVLRFPLILSKKNSLTGPDIKVRICVENSIALAQNMHLKKKLAKILKEFDDEPET